MSTEKAQDSSSEVVAALQSSSEDQRASYRQCPKHMTKPHTQNWSPISSVCRVILRLRSVLVKGFQLAHTAPYDCTTTSGRMRIFAQAHSDVRPTVSRPPTVVGPLPVVREFSHKRTGAYDHPCLEHVTNLTPVKFVANDIKIY
jgi:hypothetical protein